MTESSTLSIRAYAKHRGCNEATVRKALTKGRIVAEADGRIDPVRADREWQASTRVPVRTSHPGTQEGTHPGTQVRTPHAEPGEVRVEMEPQPHGGALKRERKEPNETQAEADRRKAISLANTREMEEAKLARELVNRRAVGAAWFNVAREARNQMEAVPDRVADRAGLTTEQRDVLQEELRLVLRTLTREVPGTGDAVPELGRS